jgi:hypothetical protein
VKFPVLDSNRKSPRLLADLCRAAAFCAMVLACPGLNASVLDTLTPLGPALGCNYTASMIYPCGAGTIPEAGGAIADPLIFESDPFWDYVRELAFGHCSWAGGIVYKCIQPEGGARTSSEIGGGDNVIPPLDRDPGGGGGGGLEDPSETTAVPEPSSSSILLAVFAAAAAKKLHTVSLARGRRRATIA